MKVILRIVLLFFFMVAQPVFAFAAGPQAENTANFLSMSDIHFNPFESCDNKIPCPLVKTLQQTSSDQWSSVLGKYQVKPSSYGTDTNYPSLKSALTEASKRAIEKHVYFVVVLGDYLAHDYLSNYSKYSGDKSPGGYQAFVKKTQTFLAGEIGKAFPDQNVFMAVGNNDSYVDDYVSQPNGQFYQDMAALWSGLVKDKNAQTALQKMFPEGGYYAVDVPNQPNLRLIVVNSVLFSMKAKGDGVDAAASKELDWLQGELANVSAQRKKALIILHIPVGVDIYSSLKATPFNPVLLWKPAYSTRFLAELKQYAANISGVLSGHFHMDFFQILDRTTPVLGTPAISPGFGNNPGFKVFSYSPTSLELVDYSTYFNALNGKQGWTEEYDFNQIYQPACKDCQVLNGMSLLQPKGNLATDYINYFGVGSGSQPISSKWLPYYWCSINTAVAAEYLSCVNGTK
jgi:sphingomyelin phosphodiesterase acid-like 3